MAVKKWICILIIVSGHVQSTTSSPLFQCQRSGQKIYTPNIPDSYFNDPTSLRADIVNNTVRAAPSGSIYVFTIPAQHNCSGTVWSVQFCYQQRMIGQRMMGGRVIFTLFQLSNTGQMTNCINIPVERSNTMCSTDDSLCCQISQIKKQFRISTSNYTFGVMSRSELQLLAFSDSVMRYQVEHYQTSDLETQPPPLMNGSLLLLRFFIRM